MPINAFIAIGKAIDQKGVGRESTWLHTWGQGEYSSFQRSPKTGKGGANLLILTEGLTLKLLGVRVNLVGSKNFWSEKKG